VRPQPVPLQGVLPPPVAYLRPHTPAVVHLLHHRVAVQYQVLAKVVTPQRHRAAHPLPVRLPRVRPLSAVHLHHQCHHHLSRLRLVRQRHTVLRLTVRHPQVAIVHRRPAVVLQTRRSQNHRLLIANVTASANLMVDKAVPGRVQKIPLLSPFDIRMVRS
jgi:hypothetical protein